MNTKLFTATLLILFISIAAFTQRPPRQGPPGPGGPPPRGGIRPPMGENGPEGPPPGDWIKPHDANENEMLEPQEFQAAMDRSFAEFDKNGNGIIEAGEMTFPPRPEHGGRPMRDGMRPGPEPKRILPPFFFLDRVGDADSFSKTEFEKIVRGVFTEMDKNGDGTLQKVEARKMPGRGPNSPPPMAPNARFIAAELRFGDKLVQGRAFSAETVIEDTRRLYDGSTVTKQMRGAIYRDSEGRTRREQPLEMVGGVSISGSDNKPLMLVFINDFKTKSQIFLDLGQKIARTSRMGRGEGPPEPGEPDDAKTVSLGTKTIEGVKVEGTRVTFEIPAGHLGNDKPIEVVTERWFSPELQVVVMSRHVDPLAGEHIFKLVNVKFGEPAAELFAIPSGFRTENQPDR